MEIITSKDNPIVKKTVSLRESRRERSKSGLFVIEGLRLCKDAAISGADIKTVLFSFIPSILFAFIGLLIFIHLIL